MDLALLSSFFTSYPPDSGPTNDKGPKENASSLPLPPLGLTHDSSDSPAYTQERESAIVYRVRSFVPAILSPLSSLPPTEAPFLRESGLSRGCRRSQVRKDERTTKYEYQTSRNLTGSRARDYNKCLVICRRKECG